MTSDQLRKAIIEILYKNGTMTTAAIAVELYMATADTKKALESLRIQRIVDPVMDSKGSTIRSWKLSYTTATDRYASRLP